VILLTKLDKTRILVNLETIKYVEATPDSLIRFLNGDSVIVAESLDEIHERVLESRVRTLTRVADLQHSDNR
jgi:flagellar protein FlbD